MPGYNNGVHGPGGAGHDYGDYDRRDTQQPRESTFSRVRSWGQEKVASLFEKNTLRTQNKIGRWQSHFGANTRPAGFPSPYGQDQGVQDSRDEGQAYQSPGHAGQHRYGHAPYGHAPNTGHNFSEGNANFRRGVFDLIIRGGQDGMAMLRGFEQEVRAIKEPPALPPRRPVQAKASGLSPEMEAQLGEIKEQMARFEQECRGHLEDFQARLQDHQQQAEALHSSGGEHTDAGRAEMERHDHAIAELNVAIDEAEAFLHEGLVELNNKLDQAVQFAARLAPPPPPPRKRAPDLGRVPPRKPVGSNPAEPPLPPPPPPRSTSSASETGEERYDEELYDDDRFDDAASDRTTMDRPRVMQNPPQLPPRNQSEVISGDAGAQANTAQDAKTAAQQYTHFAGAGRHQSEMISGRH